jgi:hypothetical protein
MRIYISNKKRNTILSSVEMRMATKFYLELLLPDIDLSDVIVTINSDNAIKAEGYCNAEDEVPHKSFLIDLNCKMNRTRQLKALAHECVHIKQFFLGELSLYDTNHIKWKRKKISTDEVDYWDLPSEIDAHGREPGLYYRYIWHLKKNKIKFF